MEKKERIQLIDAVRGVCLIIMVVHHVLYDMYAFCGAPWSWFSNPVWDVLHYLDAGTFILLAGLSCNFSHSNLRRGLRTLGLALVITLVTTLMGPETAIRFGILHLLSACMIFYHFTRRVWEGLPAPVLPVLMILATILAAPLTDGYPSSVPHLWMIGLVTPDFYSADYFPLLPWIFVFLLGTWCGKYVRSGSLPQWFYEAKAPALAAVGRKSIWIYMLHQPVIYGLVMLYLYLAR